MLEKVASVGNAMIESLSHAYFRLVKAFRILFQLDLKNDKVG